MRKLLRSLHPDRGREACLYRRVFTRGIVSFHQENLIRRENRHVHPPCEENVHKERLFSSIYGTERKFY